SLLQNRKNRFSADAVDALPIPELSGLEGVPHELISQKLFFMNFKLLPLLLIVSMMGVVTSSNLMSQPSLPLTDPTGSEPEPMSFTPSSANGPNLQAEVTSPTIHLFFFGL